MTEVLKVGVTHYVIVSGILFALGLLCVATRKNAIAILMGVELILNSANLNFVAFSHHVTGAVGGQVFSVFVIILAAAEAAVALAIVLSIFNKFRSIDASETTTLRE